MRGEENMSEGKRSIEVIAAVQFTGFHRWPDAPESRAYLRERHRHDFWVQGVARVRECDREIEIHDLQDDIEGNLAMLSTGDGDFGTMSCEEIAWALLDYIPVLSKVSVLEDSRAGASVARGDHRSRPEIITVCGSTRFKEEQQEVIAQLEREGVAVFSVGFFMHADGVELSEEEKRDLDQLHMDKIRMSDGIYVVNVGGYVGESTGREIAYARALGKYIRWWSKPAGGHPDIPEAGSAGGGS